MFSISKRFSFSASHQLGHLPEGHPCARLHGHNYDVEVEIQSPCLDDRGFCQVDYGELKTFFHGHSYTANQVGASAALASLELLQDKKSVRARQNLETDLRNELQSLWQLPAVGDIRQVGLIAGIELVKDWRTRKPFDLRERTGIRVCEAMAARGVLTRSIGNVIVLMPPYCTTPAQLKKIITVTRESIAKIFKN